MRNSKVLSFKERIFGELYYAVPSLSKVFMNVLIVN